MAKPVKFLTGPLDGACVVESWSRLPEVVSCALVVQPWRGESAVEFHPSMLSATPRQLAVPSVKYVRRGRNFFWLP